VTVAASLADFRFHLQRASLYATWKKANPKEDAAIVGYWEGRRGRPTSIRSEFGLSFLAAADAFRSTAVPGGKVIVESGVGIAGHPAQPKDTRPMPYPIAPIT
jgi:hypothetical protein